MSALMKKQQGWSFTGLMLVLMVAGLFVAVGFKLAPAYADHSTLKSIMEDVISDRHLLSEKKHDIRLTITKRLRLNNTTMPKDFLVIEKDKGTVKLIVNYELRVPMFYNVDALVYFDEVYEGRELD